jgi:thiol:disulfide interchange protein DsbD
MKSVKLILTLLVVLILSPVSSWAGNFSDRLGNLFGRATGSGGDQILKADDAFRLSVKSAGKDKLTIRWDIEDGYYLYRDKFALSAVEDTIQIKGFSVPQGKVKIDPAFGEVEVNYNLVEIDVPVDHPGNEAVQFDLEVKYQGCKEDSVCYPPIKKIVPMVLDVVSTSAIAATLDSTASDYSPTQKISEQDSITRKLQEGSFLLNIITFFGFGLLLSLTPCIFPMVPILSGIIVGQSASITTVRAFILSLTYVLAMAVTYSILGIIAGSFNLNLQAASQNFWVISLFAAVFVLLALSMFGFYELQLPSSWQSRLTKASEVQQGGTIKGTAIMGILSAIIVGPCVAPPLAGALLYISQTGDALLGGLALFAMGLGFGVPLLVIGTSTGKLLPKAGGWMDVIKRIFGVIMLGVAIWFLERILPGSVTLLLWAILLITSAVYMGAMDKMEQQTSWRHLWKGLGLVMLIYGVILIAGAVTGGKDVLRPLESLTLADSTHKDQTLSFKYIKGIDELNKNLAEAGMQGKLVMLDFYADWCVTCNEMEKYTFTDPGVKAVLKDVILLKTDVTSNDAEDQALLKKFDLFGPPAIMFFDQTARERKAYRLVGFVNAEKFITHVREATTL